MDDELMNLIRREIHRAMRGIPHPRVAEITSYDPDRHAVKAKLMPEGVETGWMHLGTGMIGNGWGVAMAAQIGDQITVGFHDGDLDSPFVMGRVFSDKDQAPKAEEGEMVFKHKAGGKLTFSKDGVVTVDNTGRDVVIKGGKIKVNPT